MPEHRPAEPDILRYYTDVFAEADRLHRTPQGRLEFARTKELLARVLPDAPATVLDIGVAEFTAAGLPAPRLYGIEGPLWPLLDALGVQPTERLFTDALDCARVVESDPSVLGSSGHLLAVAVA
ncbi:hypothetical protein [Micromonospora sp. NBC_01412]|uniref:hypothetical protein n=1 Tax=Micromonospora sp. NBC_01412 TaxID=2903590 RepID=UPI0032518CCE